MGSLSAGAGFWPPRRAMNYKRLIALSVVMRDDTREPLLIFSRRNERTNHGVLLVYVSQRTAVNLSEPKHESRNIRISSEIPTILREDEGSVILGIYERAIVDRIGVYVVICNPIDNGPTPTGIIKRDQVRSL